MFIKQRTFCEPNCTILFETDFTVRDFILLLHFRSLAAREDKLQQGIISSEAIHLAQVGDYATTDAQDFTFIVNTGI